jgi:hypothetical protein
VFRLSLEVVTDEELGWPQLLDKIARVLWEWREGKKKMSERGSRDERRQQWQDEKKDATCFAPHCLKDPALS